MSHIVAVAVYLRRVRPRDDTEPNAEWAPCRCAIRQRPGRRRCAVVPARTEAVAVHVPWGVAPWSCARERGVRRAICARDRHVRGTGASFHNCVTEYAMGAERVGIDWRRAEGWYGRSGVAIWTVGCKCGRGAWGSAMLTAYGCSLTTTSTTGARRTT